MKKIVLNWDKFNSFIEARKKYKNIPCVYVQANSIGNPIRIGKASKGLETRYRGGSGYALEAAMYNSGNLFFVSKVKEETCNQIENNLIYQYRQELKYNNIGKQKRLSDEVAVIHRGKSPKFKQKKIA